MSASLFMQPSYAGGGGGGQGEWQGLMPDTIHCDAKYFGFDGQWNFAAKKRNPEESYWAGGLGAGALAFLCHNIIDDIVF